VPVGMEEVEAVVEAEDRVLMERPEDTPYIRPGPERPEDCLAIM